MKLERQLYIISLFDCGLYKMIEGELFRHRKDLEYIKMKGIQFETGYCQYQLQSNGKRITAYRHQISYLYYYGQYPENYVIDHLNRDKSNCLPENLRAVTQKVNVQNSEKPNRSNVKLNTLRSEEIKTIRKLNNEGMSQNAISKKMNLHRLSVRYVIKKTESGEPLKYE